MNSRDYQVIRGEHLLDLAQHKMLHPLEWNRMEVLDGSIWRQLVGPVTLGWSRPCPALLSS